MKRYFTLALLVSLSFLASQASAQEHYTEGPIWRITLVKILPGKLNDFMIDLRKNVKPTYEEFKKQGIIMEYSISLKSTTEGPDDWNVAIALKYKSFASLDGLIAKTDPVTLKLYGSKEARQQAVTKRTEVARIISSFLMRQIELKDFNEVK